MFIFSPAALCLPATAARKKPENVLKETDHHLTFTAMFDAEKDRIHAINNRLDQLRGYL